MDFITPLPHVPRIPSPSLRDEGRGAEQGIGADPRRRGCQTRPALVTERQPSLMLYCSRDHVLSFPYGLGSVLLLLSLDTSQLSEKSLPYVGETPFGKLHCFPYQTARLESTSSCIMDRLARGPARGRGISRGAC